MAAITSGANNIHIEPLEKEVRVRMRHDGRLLTYGYIPAERRDSVVARIKVLAQLDIAERRRPQGRSAAVRAEWACGRSKQDGVGKSLRDALSGAANLPPLLLAMAAAGDTSGRLERVFERAADHFENELETTLDTLVSLLEPAVILVLGSVLCWVLAALYLPMFEMASVVR